MRTVGIFVGIRDRDATDLVIFSLLMANTRQERLISIILLISVTTSVARYLSYGERGILFSQNFEVLIDHQVKRFRPLQSWVSQHAPHFNGGADSPSTLTDTHTRETSQAVPH
jgi:hypothetical protein